MTLLHAVGLQPIKRKYVFRCHKLALVEESGAAHLCTRPKGHPGTCRNGYEEAYCLLLDLRDAGLVSEEEFAEKAAQTQIIKPTIQRPDYLKVTQTSLPQPEGERSCSDSKPSVQI